ncbi:ABC transporter substrate-binding protein [Microbacterium sp.]|uniref:ABC transporter substrate-binding protein n=1 Tax=Microbacterium sp. TaxID=51671 RepID=UPI003F700649
MLRPLIAVPVIAIAVGGLLAGCSAGGGGGDTDGGVTKISFWARDAQESFVPELAEAFNASQSEIEVEVTIIPGGQYTQKFASATAGGTPPDVAAMDLVLVPYYAQAGALLDLTERAESLDYMDDFDSAHLGTIEWDGKTVAIPFSAEASVLYYNKDLFAAAGLDPEKPPTTWDEMKEYASKITALGDGNHGFWMVGNATGGTLFTVTPYMYAAGADLLTEGPDPDNLDFDSAPVKDALTFLRDMWQAGDMPPDAKSDTGAGFYSTFATGKVGMQGGGAFGIADIIAQDKFDLGVTFLPGPTDGTRGSFAGGDDLVIPAGSKNADAAWKFIEWATSVEAQEKYLADLGTTPVRLSVAKGYYSEKDPRLATLAEALELGKTPVTPDLYPIFNNAGSPWNNLLQGAIFGSDSVDSVAKEQQAIAEDLITTQK